jgi:hypothetical protein
MYKSVSLQQALRPDDAGSYQRLSPRPSNLEHAAESGILSSHLANFSSLFLTVSLHPRARGLLPLPITKGPTDSAYLIETTSMLLGFAPVGDSGGMIVLLASAVDVHELHTAQEVRRTLILTRLRWGESLVTTKSRRTAFACQPRLLLQGHYYECCTTPDRAFAWGLHFLVSNLGFTRVPRGHLPSLGSQKPPRADHHDLRRRRWGGS